MHRRVRQLRLSCAREEHARHGRVLLEDAMRTAALGDEGRLIIVRRLSLGRIPLRASATHWSLRLENSYRAAQPTLVHASHPGADRANAVYFANATEPWLLLAERAAANRPCTEWFWPRALPGWHRSDSAAQSLRVSVRALAAGGGLRATLGLAQRLMAARSLTTLLQSLQPEDLAPLARELEGGAATPDPSSPAGVIAGPGSRSPPLTVVELSFVRSWGARDVRTTWLAAVWLARQSSLGTSALTPLSIAPAEVDALVRQWFEPAVPANAASAAASSPLTARRAHAPPDVAVAVANDSSLATAESPTPDTPRVTPPEAPERLFTRAGGLFFTVPLLARAGLPAFLETLPSHEAAALPWHLVRLMLRHGRIAAGDPLFAATDSLLPTQQKIGRWLLAAHRRALRVTALNLRAIVVRPALLSLSPTHIDVFFRATEADIRLRRAGLDLNPGWVPWLGRAIAFHFNRED